MLAALDGLLRRTCGHKVAGLYCHHFEGKFCVILSVKIVSVQEVIILYCSLLKDISRG